MVTRLPIASILISVKQQIPINPATLIKHAKSDFFSISSLREKKLLENNFLFLYKK